MNDTENAIPTPTHLVALSHDEEPIAALASGSGAAGIAVIRLAGKDCHSLLASCLRRRHRDEAWQPYRMYLADLREPTTGELIDEAMATYFYAPHSYTGQDTVEVYLHGGPYIVQRALGVFFSQGFRPAEPGEFTRRAFLGGKMDLTTAEGVGELVAASTHQQWLAGRQLASGRLRQAIADLRRLTMEAMAWLEARIDFPDEGETSAVEMQEVEARVDKVADALERLAASYDNGRVASRGLMVALVGEPNAGKSTLLNCLLGSDRAIVTEHAGTTRDYLEEACLLDGRLIRLVDTAGIRASGFDAIEKLGIERSRAIAREADVVVFLLAADTSQASLEQITQWRADLKPADELLVITKSDLGQPEWLGSLAPTGYLMLSCQNGQGLAALRAHLAAKVDSHIGQLSTEEAFITSARHKAALAQAREALGRFQASRTAGAYEEMLAFELQQVAKSLASVIGEVAADDVLGVIFSSFCVGK